MESNTLMLASIDTFTVDTSDYCNERNFNIVISHKGE